MLPLANAVLLDYTMETLSQAKVAEVYIICVQFAEMINEHLQKMQWTDQGMVIKIVCMPEAASLGDAMRDLDSRDIIHGDFVLCYGDTVSNLNLAAVVQEHKANRKINKKLVMTKVLKEALPKNSTREKFSGGVFALKATGECVAYYPYNPEKKCVLLSDSLFKGKSEISLRNDLMNPSMCVCSLEVLALFTENFDYQDLSNDFLPGVLNSELIDYSINTFITTEYVARATSTNVYDSISRDVMMRWTFPIVPDSGLLCEPYTFRKGFVYLGANVVSDRTSVVKDHVIIGHGVTIGANTVIRNTTIGDNCRIGDDCVLDGAYVWTGVVIENGCKISSSIVASYCKIREQTKIGNGCIISFGSTIGPRIEIANTLVTRFNIDNPGHETEELQELRDKLWKAQDILGEDCDSYMFEQAVDSDDENFEWETFKRRNRMIGAVKEVHEFDTLSSSDEEDGYFTQESGMEDGNFKKEGKEFMKYAIDKDYTVDNALIELNSLKFSCNATFRDCRSVILQVLFECVDLESKKLAVSVKKLFGTWSDLLQRFTHNEADQKEILYFISDYCQRIETFLPAAKFVLPMLYDNDVVEEEPLLEWFEEDKGPLKAQVASFIDWLRTQETESE